MKDRAARNRELATAFGRLAAPHSAAREVPEIDAATLGAEGFAAVAGEAYRFERVVSLLVRQAQHVRQTERPGLCAEEEVLRHVCLKQPLSVIYGRVLVLATAIYIRYTLYLSYLTCEERMAGFARNEAEIAERASKFIKAELKRIGLTYDDLADRLARHGVKGETRNSITSKLARGTFPATFFIGSIAALEREGVKLEEL